ncbi:MAG: hypothetical protein ACH0QD_13365 [Tepidibacillus sp.]
MKVTIQKKAVFPFFDLITLPKKEEEPTVLITTLDKQIEVVIHHPAFVIRFLTEAIVEEPGKTSCTFSSVKKALSSTKAKVEIVLTDSFVIQEKEIPIQRLDVNSPSFRDYLLSQSPTLFSAELKGETWAKLLTPLTVFPQNDNLYPWRGQIHFEKKEKGIQFTQSDGIHLATTFVSGQFGENAISSGAISSYAFHILKKTLPLFTKGRWIEGSQMVGLLEDSLFVGVSYSESTLPNIQLPAFQEETKFHLNPLWDESKKKPVLKPFEYHLLEKLRTYRDQHFIEYADIVLKFLAQKKEQEFEIEALVSHEGIDFVPLLSTTSPFFSGSLPDILLPAYDLIKALESFPDITSLKMTERGVQLEYIEMEQGILRTILFVHGVKA